MTTAEKKREGGLRGGGKEERERERDRRMAICSGGKLRQTGRKGAAANKRCYTNTRKTDKQTDQPTRMSQVDSI